MAITMQTKQGFDGKLSNSAEVSSDVDDPLTAGAGHENIILGDITVRLKGDLNGDGCVGNKDLRMITNVIRGTEPVDPSYDVNGDGKVNNNDISFMARNLFTGPGGVPCR